MDQEPVLAIMSEQDSIKQMLELVTPRRDKREGRYNVNKLLK